MKKNSKIEIAEVLEKSKPEIEKNIKKYFPKKVAKKWLKLVLEDPNFILNQRAIEKALQEPIWNFLDRKGKRWRSFLFLLTFKALGGRLKKFKDLAIIPELIHEGCLTKNTYILKNPGEQVKINQIKIGDYLYTIASNGKLTKNKVLAKKFTGIKKVYRLVTRNREIEATKNHPFLVITKKQPITKFESPGIKLKWIPLGKLKKEDKIIVLNKVPNHGKPLKLPQVPKDLIKDKTTLPKETTEEFCQLVGYILGNGVISINRKDTRIYLCPSNNKEEILAYSSLFSKVFSYELKRYKGSEHLYCGSFKIGWLLGKLGLHKKTTKKILPNWIFTLPERQKLAFLRGYLDSDGWVDKDGKTYFSSSSKILIKKLKLLLDSLGLTTSQIFCRKMKNLWKISKRKFSNQWIIFLSNPHLVLEKIGTEKSFYKKRLKRKQKRKGNASRDLEDFLNLPIDFSTFRIDKVKEIKFIGKEPVYDLMIENSHNFIANNIAVHNSLIVDDVEDDSKLRRGKPCLHKIFGTDVAINAGNFLYFFPLIVLIKNKDKFESKVLNRAYEIYIQAMIKLHIGQGIDIFWHNQKDKNINEKQYFQICALKTSAILRMLTKLAALFSGANLKLTRKLEEIVQEIGIAFQIQDDILDLTLTGKEREKFGKSFGNDIKEGKVTLPLIFTLKKASKEDKKRLLEILAKHTDEPKEIKQAFRIIEKYKGISYARKKAQEIARKAQKKIISLPLEPWAKKNFLELLNFLIQRKI